MRKITLSALALGLVLAAGSASAAAVNDDFLVTVQVDATCSISSAATDVFITHNQAVFGNTGQASSSFGVICNQDLPYTLEVDSAATGAIVLTDAATLKTVPAKLQITSQDLYSLAVWGQAINGEQYSAIGTGLQDAYEIDVRYDNGKAPAVGTYTKLNNITLSF